jgi:hypothetical protein
MKRWLVVVVAAFVLLLLPRDVRSVPLPGEIDDQNFDCLELTPTAVHVPVVDSDERVFLDIVLVLHGQVTDDRGRDVLRQASQRSFEPLGVELRVADIRRVETKATTYQEFLKVAKRAVGGKRPPGTEVVALLTSVDFSDNLIGYADCIGGIRYDDRSFFVVEDTTFTFGPEEGRPSSFHGGFTVVKNLAARAFAHELGHLVGAHHHYGNCGPSFLDDTSDLSPCTLMFPFASYISDGFGALDAAVARGHIEEHAED